MYCLYACVSCFYVPTGCVDTECECAMCCVYSFVVLCGGVVYPCVVCMCLSFTCVQSVCVVFGIHVRKSCLCTNSVGGVVWVVYPCVF